ncbi:hypothetical protein [Absidia glauca]|uniref:Uncharacterized protein n=1 Tax=Absidia glauca TaxID=4829 RepID=A0A163J5U8_ABSGL|nr:hypothetical protein [Absidia glauca]
MVFPTVSYSTKLTLKKSTPPSSSTTSSPATTKKPRLGQSKIGPRSAPDRYDRIAAYDRAFQKYIQKDSKLASWKQKMDEKGLPNPLIEGYQRSSTSWQHSLSSLSSDSSSSSSSSTTSISKEHSAFSRTMKRFDLKPMRSVTITSSSPSSFPPISVAAPMPKPSVSRRIINRLSLSINSKGGSIKVAPTATQSMRRHSHHSEPPQHYRCHYHYPPVMSSPQIIPPVPSTSQHYHYPNHHHPSRLLQRSLDRPLQPVNTMKKSPYTPTIITPPSPPSSPCSMDESNSLKRHIGSSSPQYCHRQKVIAK